MTIKVLVFTGNAYVVYAHTMQNEVKPRYCDALYLLYLRDCVPWNLLDFASSFVTKYLIGLEVQLHNRGGKPLLVLYLDMVPWFVRIYLHTLRIEAVGEEGNPLASSDNSKTPTA